jgi:hypothetical protein
MNTVLCMVWRTTLIPIWSTKLGLCGHGVSGEKATMHDFAMSSAIQNTINAFEDIKKTERNTVPLSEHCRALGHELYAYAIEMD